MAYTAHTWTDGELITAEKLNSLEQATASVSVDCVAYVTFTRGEDDTLSCSANVEDLPEMKAAAAVFAYVPDVGTLPLVYASDTTAVFSAMYVSGTTLHVMQVTGVYGESEDTWTYSTQTLEI